MDILRFRFLHGVVGLLLLTGVAFAQVIYQPGDWVEVQFAGGWAKGMIVPFQASDIDSQSGRYYRVRLERFWDFAADGTVYNVEFIRGKTTPPPGKGAVASAPPGSPPAATGARRYKPGDIVEMSFGGRWIRAEVMPAQPGDTQPTSGEAVYRIRHEYNQKLYPEGVETMERYLRPASAQTIAQTPPPVIPPAPPSGPGKPAMKGKLPKIPGTAWKQLFKQDVMAVPLFLFCSTGRWELQRASGAIGMQGTYKVQGGTLALRGEDGKTERYSMRWDGNYLYLTGSVVMKLKYNGTTSCK